jgi:hypothetical protein
MIYVPEQEEEQSAEGTHRLLEPVSKITCFVDRGVCVCVCVRESPWGGDV